MAGRVSEEEIKREMGKWGLIHVAGRREKGKEK